MIHCSQKKGPTVVTCAEMKALERQPTLLDSPMFNEENAGSRAADFVVQTAPQRRNVLVLAGKGNNGGDGHVVARLLADAGYPVTVVLVEGVASTPDASANLGLLPKTVDVFSLDAFNAEKKRLFETTAPCIVVDAIFGTGFHGVLPEKSRSL